MKMLHCFPIIFVFAFYTSCGGQPEMQANRHVASDAKDSVWSPPKVYGPKLNPTTQISRYIRRMFQDRAGNIWFGTNGEGVCRYDGKNYVYFSSTDLRSGFGGEAVRGIIQEENGTIWFGTEGGISVFDGKKFTTFALPKANLVKVPDAYPAPKLINSIFQDKVGNIWFGSNGNGVYRFDGKSIENISEKNGLCNNFVQCITQDKKGNLWFGTRFGGMSKFDGKTFTTFNENNGLKNNFVWTFHEDKSGNLWIGNAGGGLTRYDGKTFTNYMENEGLPNRFIQSFLEDNDGKFWIGTSGGAFTFDGKTFVNITRPVTDGC